jgi:hypothetical protein
MRALIVDDVVRAAIRRVVDHAENFPFVVGVVKLIAAGHLASPTFVDPGLRLTIPVGWRVCFTIEQHPPYVWCRHISVSVAGDEMAGANMLGVQAIMTEFGMNGAIEDCAVYVEHGDHPAINVVDRIRGELPAACRRAS